MVGFRYTIGFVASIELRLVELNRRQEITRVRGHREFAEFRFDISAIWPSDYSSVLIVISRMEIRTFTFPAGPGFNIQYQNWPQCRWIGLKTMEMYR